MKFSKLASILLALCLCANLIPLTAHAAGSVIPEDAPEYEELRLFLQQFHVSWGNQTYDSRNISMQEKNILQALLFTAPCYVGPTISMDMFHAEEDSGKNDPLGKWGAYMYSKWNGSQVEWVLENVFNCSPADISNLQSALSKSTQGEYYSNGYYYSPAYGIGGIFGMAVITDITPYENYYFVTYELRNDPDWADNDANMVQGRFFAVVERKTVNGKGYWSLYYHRALANGETLNLPTSSVDIPPASIENFTDVKSSDYFYNAAHWGVEQGIIYGTATDTFSPNDTCTKAQILTFLWRASGSPEPSISNPYSDVYGGSYYYKAALWASKEHLVPSGTFNADEPCTRGRTMDYLWKLAGSPVATGDTFSDVPYTSEYVRPVLWAVSVGITVGTGGTAFSPDAICTRAQIITFIYRAAGYETVTPPNLSSNATNNYSGWSQAYQDFVINEKFLTIVVGYNSPSRWGNEVGNHVILYDMDVDSVPELLIYNGYDNRHDGRYYAYTYADGQVTYIGLMDGFFGIKYNPNSRLTGIWSYWTLAGADPDDYSYYWKEGNHLQRELVYSQEFNSTYKKQLTSDKELYNEFVSVDYYTLPSPYEISISEIRSVGWDAFIARALG